MLQQAIRASLAMSGDAPDTAIDLEGGGSAAGAPSADEATSEAEAGAVAAPIDLSDASDVKRQCAEPDVAPAPVVGVAAMPAEPSAADGVIARVRLTLPSEGPPKRVVRAFRSTDLVADVYVFVSAQCQRPHPIAAWRSGAGADPEPYLRLMEDQEYFDVRTPHPSASLAPRYSDTIEAAGLAGASLLVTVPDVA